MTPIETTNGGENPASGASKLQLYAFVKEANKEIFLADAVGRVPNFTKVSEPSHVQALKGYDMKIGGRWVNQIFVIPDGQLLVIHGNKKRHFRDVGEDARMILRVRSRAALREITFKTMQISQVSTMFNVAAIKGRFDVISLQDAMKVGYVIPPMARDHFEQSSILSMFSCKILETELQSADAHIAIKTNTGVDGGDTVFLRERRRTL